MARRKSVPAEVKQALEVIKNFCGEDKSHCEKCPFYHARQDDCELTMDAPQNWDID